MKKMEFIPSSEINCPKSGFLWWVGQNNFEWNHIIYK